MFISENSENNLKCCFTGYRPSKLPFNVYKRDKAYVDFENLIISGILNLSNEGCHTFYTGMAMGFDIICAETVLLIKKTHKYPLSLVCAIPFEEQSEKFSAYWKEKYDKILNESDEKIIISDRYYKGCYHKRNKFMVDSCDYVMTWFDGKTGGTKNTVDYALKNNKFVMNLNTSIY